MRITVINRETNKSEQEIVPAGRMMAILYGTYPGKLALHALVKRKFLSRLVGWWMDRPASVSKIKSFVEQLNIDMEEVERPMDDFVSFNDFLRAS